MMVIVAMVGVIGMAGTAEAVSYVFNNGIAGAAWSTGTNWTPNNPAGLPDIQGGNDYTVNPGFSPTLAAGQVNMGSAGAGTATLNINNTSGADTLTLSGLFGYGGANAQITQTGGTFNVGSANGMGWGFSPAGHTSTYNMSGSGSVLNNVGFLYLGRDAGATANFIQTDGTTIWGNGADYFSVACGFADDAGTALYEISGGSMTVNATTAQIWIGTRWTAAGDGGAGTFKVVGTGPSAITWTGNANLDGQGSAKGELAFTMDASGVTPIALNGALNLNNLPLLTLDFSALPGGVGNIPLVNTTGGITGAFLVNPLGDDPASRGYTLSYTGGNVVLVGTSTGGGVIPEPAGLGLIGLALLAVRKRRS